MPVVVYPEGGISMGSAVTGATAGSVFFAGASGVMAQDNAALFFDTATDQLRLASDAALRIYNAAGSYHANVVELRSQGYANSTYFQVGEGTAASFSIFTGSAAGGYFRVCDREAVFNPFQFYTYTTAAQRFVVNTYSAATVGQIINLAAAQSADAFQVKNSSSAVIASITKDGYFSMATDGQLLINGTAILRQVSGGGYCGFNIDGLQAQTRIGGSVIYFGSGLKTYMDGPTGALTFTEQTAPSAPGANEGTLYLEDNGAGKTKLMIRFNTGAAQQIAIEP